MSQEFDIIEVESDDEGFIKDFGIDDEEEYMEFFNKYGFVVIRNILSQEEIDNSIDEIWRFVEACSNYRIKRNDPRTYHPFIGLTELGLIGQALGKNMWGNRFNKKLVRAFRKILQREDVLVSIDNFGMLRPTKNIPQCELPMRKNFYSLDVPESMKDDDDIDIVDMENWKTDSKWLHWDLNPFAWLTNKGTDYTFDCCITENNGTKASNQGNIKLQGLVNFCDARVEDGGFLTVPGFRKYLREWVDQECYKEYETRFSSTFDFVSVPNEDPMQKQIKKIPMRAGSLLIWHSEQPHCNYANDSNRFRIVQYIKAFPCPSNFDEHKENRRNHIMLLLNDSLNKEDLDEILGDSEKLRLLGLEDYDVNSNNEN